MKKRFLLMTIVLAVGLGGSGCVLPGNRGFETITDAGISNAEKNDVSEEETLIVEETSEVVPETDESMEQEVSSDTTESSVASEESESPEETESVETTESNQEPATETTPEIPREASEMFHSTNSAQNPAFCGLWVHSLKTSDKVLKYGENNRVDFSEHPTVVKRGSVRTINIYAAVPDVA